MRKLWAIIAGFVAAMAITIGVEYISHVLYPPPAHLNPLDPADLEQLLELMPTGAMLLVIAAHFLAVLVGNWVLLKIAKGYQQGVYVLTGGFFLLAIMNVVMVGHETWFLIADAAAILLAGGWMYKRSIA